MRLFVGLALLGATWAQLAAINMLSPYFFGKDECARTLDSTATPPRVDCAAGTLNPAEDGTILVPAQTSNTTNSALAATFAAGTQTITLPYTVQRNPAPTALTLALSAAPVGMGGTCTNVDTSAGNTAAATVTGGQITWTFPAAWGSVMRELLSEQNGPFLLCAAPTGTTAFQYTGLNVKAVWNCDSSATAPASLRCDISQPAIMPTFGPNDALYLSTTVEERLFRRSRTLCCQQTSTFRVGTGIGQCVNPSINTCCNGGAVNPATERCCNAPQQNIRTFPNACPCTRSGASATPPDCPTGEVCCLPNKYPEFATDAAAAGQCYNPATFNCCNTGQRFDPGTQQCCQINGLQSLDVPCPCANDTHCMGGQTNGVSPTNPTASPITTSPTNNFICCSQVNPVPREANVTQINTDPCTIYANFPTGTGPFAAQRCLGRCIDPRYQICCNGAICRLEYERCCNATCCNTFTGTCERGFRAGAVGNPVSTRDFRVEFEFCTTIEQIDPIKAFWLFVWPSALLLATLGSLALVLIFANKAAIRRYHFIEKALIAVAVLVLLMAVPFFFSPLWKYGLAAVVAALIVIITAAARFRVLNVLAVVVVAALVFYLFDFFNGNAWWNASSNRLAAGPVDPDSNGLWSSINELWRPLFMTQTPTSMLTSTSQRFCTNFYNYFLLDRMLADNERLTNPEVPTFGYCSRGWIFALLVFGGFLILFAILLLLLALIALILRYKEARGFDPIELEVRAEGSSVSGYDYGYGSSSYGY